ncbi:MAG: gamma-glutamylcyclotransferase [Gemmatimonadetes bacterium]|nr:gamma-glutamylcyclotransferase [Gemmatimonadota bacterium]
MKTPPLFVYGTLRRAPTGAHPLLRAARFVQHASMRGKLYDLGEYPGAYRKSRTSLRVFGELYELPTHEPHVLKALDEYEGPEFVRRRVFVTLRNGRRRAAWTYVLRKAPHRTARPLPSGRYQSRRGAA